MKPKTKIQKQVAELSKRLSAISDKQRQWAIDHIFKKTCYLRKSSTWCLECGNTWKVDNSLLINIVDNITCPHCGAELVASRSSKRSFEDRWYYTVYDKSEGFQVLRHFVASKECKVGQPAILNVRECVQNWISPIGKVVNISLPTNMGGYCYDNWIFGSEMEIRGSSSNPQRYDVYAQYIYPSKVFIPELKRNGFTGNLHGISPVKIISSLLSNSKIETLLKSKQYNLLKYWVSTGSSMEELNTYWPSIKICIRNNYIVKDASIYIDYLNLLEYFGKDLRNPKYVCSGDMKKEHDRLSRKRHKIKQEEAKKEKAKKALENENKFRKLKGCFFGITFSDELITVKVLESVKEYMEEGEDMHHCVFSNGYYLKPKSLILTAIIGNEHVATIELSLEAFNVEQCRGKCNKISEYNDRIIDLVNKNIGLIRDRMKSNKKSNKAA